MKDLFVNYGMILFAKLDRLFLFVFRTNKVDFNDKDTVSVPC